MPITKALQQAIDDAYNNHGYSEDGIACLRQKINGAGLRGPALDWAAANLLRLQMAVVRHEIQSGKQGDDPVVYDPEHARAVQAACRGFLQRPMMDGTLLAEATKDVLDRDARHYEALAKGNAREARFLRLVESKVKEGQKVGEVWTEEKLVRLYARVRKE